MTTINTIELENPNRIGDLEVSYEASVHALPENPVCASVIVNGVTPIIALGRNKADALRSLKKKVAAYERALEEIAT